MRSNCVSITPLAIGSETFFVKANARLNDCSALTKFPFFAKKICKACIGGVGLIYLVLEQLEPKHSAAIVYHLLAVLPSTKPLL